MQYYDVFSKFYESGTEKLHGGHRLEALDLLRLEPGAAVLDVPTGTGANLPLLIDRIGPTGEICAIDYSPGMLAKARAKIEAAGWTNVHLVQADARELDADMAGRDQFDAAVCILGLSVVPDWEAVFQRMFDLVRPGGRIAVMDLYLSGKRTSGPANLYYRLLAQADQRRRFWEPLEAQSDEFEIIDHDWFGGVARVVAGTKRVDAVDLREASASDADVDLTRGGSETAAGDTAEIGATDKEQA